MSDLREPAGDSDGPLAAETTGASSVAVEALMFEVFAEQPGGGNPCPVIPAADRLDADDMQRLAASYGHESVFLLSPTIPGAQVRMRYFVPLHEMEMCVHATVAALTFLFEEGLVQSGAVSIQTPLGLLATEIGSDVTADMEISP